MARKAAGIGYSEASDAYTAGKDAAGIAIKDGNFEEFSLVLVFASCDVDSDALENGIRAIVGETVPIIGGAAVGIITGSYLSYEGTQVGLAVFDESFLRAKVASTDLAQNDLQRAGADLAESLRIEESARAMLLFYDSANPKKLMGELPSIHSSLPILEGVYSRQNFPVDIFGAGMIGSFDLAGSFIFCGHGAETQRLVGAALHGSFNAYSIITHGCSPLDGVYRRITRQSGSVIMELDGKPVVEVIDEIYGSSIWREEVPVKGLTIGLNRGPRFAAFNEENYVCRLILGPLPDDSGIVLFEEGPQEGEEIQFLQRDTARMMDSAKAKSKELLSTIQKAGKTPQFAFYIDCAGRAAAYSHTQNEEAAFIQSAMNEANVPLLGIYSGVELAPVNGKSRSLDWTGVLLILAD